jgi:hypothetical protein
VSAPEPYEVSNAAYLYEWLKLNCSAGVGRSALDWVAQMCAHPHAHPPEGAPTHGTHPQTKLTLVRTFSQTLHGSVGRKVLAIEYLIIDERTEPPIPGAQPRTIEIVFLQAI